MQVKLIKFWDNKLTGGAAFVALAHKASSPEEEDFLEISSSMLFESSVFVMDKLEQDALKKFSEGDTFFIPFINGDYVDSIDSYMDNSPEMQGSQYWQLDNDFVEDKEITYV